jgi:hypothetical protein
MFETIRRSFPFYQAEFFGTVDLQGGWAIELDRAVKALERCVQNADPVLVVGTAFLFVHLLDHLAATGLVLKLPPGSRAMETGGYKGRSRILSKEELHARMTERLGITSARIVSEYGMSELSSQAYDRTIAAPAESSTQSAKAGPERIFRFPFWAQAQIISPETGREVADGETGLVRVLDLANVYSVAAVQTEDLATRRGAGFELIGRAPQAEPRGCSLMT